MTKRKKTKAANGKAEPEWKNNKWWLRISTAGGARRIFTGDPGVHTATERQRVADMAKPYRDMRLKPGGAKTLSDYGEECFKHWKALGKTTPETCETDRFAFQHAGWLGAKGLSTVTDEQIEKRLAELASPRVQLGFYKVLSKIFGRAAAKRLIPFNPMEAVDKPAYYPKPVVPLNNMEVETIRACAKGDPFEAYLTLALELAIGPAELLGLQWTHVDFDRRIVGIRHNLVTGKTTKWKPEVRKPKNPFRDRDLDVSQDAIEQLLARRNAHMADTFVFTENGEPYPVYKLRTQWWRSLRDRAAGIAEKKMHDKGFTSYRFPDVEPYNLRHTSCRLHGDAGTPIAVVSRMMGHASISTTHNIYGRYISDDRKVKAASAVGKRLKELSAHKKAA